MKYRVLSICSGIGGFELAMQLSELDADPVAFIEKNLDCQKLLSLRFPNVPIFDDLTTLTHEQLVTANVTNIDGIVGGLPCQPYSQAGNKKGSTDNRSLFSHYFRLLRGIRPQFSVFENVPGLLTVDDGREFRGILSTYAQIGYDAYWQTISCSEIGGVHKRERLFVTAYSQT